MSVIAGIGSVLLAVVGCGLLDGLMAVLRVLRVLHDTVLHRWETTGEFWMVSDDVVHAYGSMGHTNVLNTLLVGGVFPLWQN